MTSPLEISKEFSDSFHEHSHYLFRYPAKFHPPVAKYLIEEFTESRDRVLDPFCGSGTLLLEGALENRRMVGVDLDPVAAFVSRVKTTPLSQAETHDLEKLSQSVDAYRGLKCSAPAIPNIGHWFEPHVLDAMCELAACIEGWELTPAARDFARAVFLGRVRSWSNADPVPVSGLEVTSHIKRLRAKGHFPNVLGTFKRSLADALKKATGYASHLAQEAETPLVFQGDARAYLQSTRRKFEAIITSPPYLSAVDYYRRHTLEMYWLDRALTPDQRLKLKNNYIGQYSVTRDMSRKASSTPISKNTLAHLAEITDPKRVASAKHYFASMKAILVAATQRLAPGGRLVLVLGDGKVGKVAVPTGKLLAQELADQVIWEKSVRYPLRNRYMTYSRRNGADIGHETVYVLRKS